MHRFVGALLLALALISPAQAGWEKTEWGMTFDQIMRATGGLALPPPTYDPTGRYRAENTTAIGYIPDFKIQDYAFEVTFWANKGDTRLTRVKLNLKDVSQRFPLRNTLLNALGKPIEETRGYAGLNTLRWRDEKKQNAIRYIDLGGVAAGIDYEPIPKGF